MPRRSFAFNLAQIVSPENAVFDSPAAHEGGDRHCVTCCKLVPRGRNAEHVEARREDRPDGLPSVALPE